MHRCVFVCFCVCMSELLSVFFSSLFARGYREAGRKQSGTGGVMERVGDGGGEGRGKREREIGR